MSPAPAAPALPGAVAPHPLAEQLQCQPCEQRGAPASRGSLWLRLPATPGHQYGRAWPVGACNPRESGATLATTGDCYSDDRLPLGVHIVGDIASELVGIGQAVISTGERIDVVVTLTIKGVREGVIAGRASSGRGGGAACSDRPRSHWSLAGTHSPYSSVGCGRSN
jgi:hypothetical protein